MLSQTNGVPTATINNNNKINLNDNNCDNDLEFLQNLQTLVPAIKQNFILISQQFTQFINYTQDFDKLSSTIQFMQIKQEKLERELERLKKDREDIDKQFEINADNRVYLDIGGQRFTTTIKTLTQSNSIFFKTLIIEKLNVNKNSMDNPIFIDRDGHLFEYILKYLRTGELNIDDKTIRKDLLTEARYYKLQTLEDDLNLILRKEESFMSVNSLDAINQSPPCSPAPMMNRTRSSPYSPTPLTNSMSRTSPFSQSVPIKSKPHPAQTASSWRSNVLIENRLNIFPGSTLLTSEYEEKLMEFIGNDIQHRHQPWRLIYRASEHGFDASDFHRCCDSFAPTVSIIQTDFGNIFGGFTIVPWSSATLRADQADPTAFLFTLKNTLNIPPTKCPVAKEYQQCAISHNPTCGPNFGSPKNEGSDLCLRNKFNDKTNCIFFPKSYFDPTNQGGLIFAKKYFACKEVEVFTLMNNS
jgi:hypothetical protein